MSRENRGSGAEIRGKYHVAKGRNRDTDVNAILYAGRRLRPSQPAAVQRQEEEVPEIFFKEVRFFQENG